MPARLRRGDPRAPVRCRQHASASLQGVRLALVLARLSLQPVGELDEGDELEVGPQALALPASADAVEPARAQAGAVSTGDVRLDVVADVEHFGRHAGQARARGQQAAGVRPGGAERRGAVQARGRARAEAGATMGGMADRLILGLVRGDKEVVGMAQPLPASIPRDKARERAFRVLQLLAQSAIDAAGCGRVSIKTR